MFQSLELGQNRTEENDCVQVRKTKKHNEQEWGYAAGVTGGHHQTRQCEALAGS